MSKSSNISMKLNAAPKKPGVYQFFDQNNRILYVGKAKNLKNRVASYFNNEGTKSGRIKLLVKKISDIKYILTETEFDALLLENNLIKKHQPRYNVMLKDDKTYPWICIKNEAFPRIFKTRNIVRDGSEYYGPYASVKMLNTLLDLIRKNYKLRTCAYDLSEKKVASGKYKRCLEYHIGNCKAPCEMPQTEADYQQYLDEIRSIIKGNIASVKRKLKTLMEGLAKDLKFEEAEEIRQKIEILDRYQAKSTVVNPSIHDIDVFSMFEDRDLVYINFMKVNNGAIVQAHTIELKKKLDESKSELLILGIIELRNRFNSNSKEIIVPFRPKTEIKGVQFLIPQRGDKKKLLQFSERNAKFFMKERHKQQEKTDPERHSRRILEGLKKDLRLSQTPIHIECFDNSNIQGSNPVAACVVFKNAKPSKKDYRHYNIKTVSGPDDFASMEEVVYRRYKRLQEENKPFPQLIVIDGGKGQLSAALKSLDRLGLRGKIAIIGIAKRLEEIYFPGDQYPLYLDKTSESLKLIQHLRNEAHRFGINHHRNRRSNNFIQSELSQIKGIGEKSSMDLLRKFKSVKRVKTASLQELEMILSQHRAKTIWNYFHAKEKK